LFHNGSALHKAAFHGHLEIVKLLLAHNANKDLKDKEEQTPLHLGKSLPNNGSK